MRDGTHDSSRHIPLPYAFKVSPHTRRTALVDDSNSFTKKNWYPVEIDGDCYGVKQHIERYTGVELSLVKCDQNGNFGTFAADNFEVCQGNLDRITGYVDRYCTNQKCAGCTSTVGLSEAITKICPCADGATDDGGMFSSLSPCL